MNEWEFSFAPAPWEPVLDRLKAGEWVSAATLLTLLESEPEDGVEAAMERLREKCLQLNLGDLPRNFPQGEMAQRLRTEEQWARGSRDPGAFPESDPLRLYLEELAATPAFPEQELLAMRYADGEDQAAELLLQASLHQVVDAACQLTGRGVLLLDLIQEGSLGLWQCLPEWTGTGTFSSYAREKIYQAMARLVLRQARADGVGGKLLKLAEQYRSTDRTLLARLGHNPSVEEIALEMGITPEDAFSVQQMLESAAVLEASHQPRQDPPGEAEQAVEDTAYFQMRQRIQELLSSLEELDGRILTLRFGLEGSKPATVGETANILSLTEQEVSAREAAALLKLRNEEFGGK